MDTVDEFVQVAGEARFPLPRGSILGRLRMIGPLRELADSISNGGVSSHAPI